MAGLATKGASIASLMAASAAATVKQRAHAMLMLFTDCRSAFYPVVKGFLSRHAQNTDQVEQALDAMEILLALQPLFDSLIAAPTLPDQIDNQHLLASAVDTLISMPSGGTRPGMPLAGHLFNIAFSPTQCSINNRLSKLNPCSPLRCPTRTPRPCSRLTTRSAPKSSGAPRTSTTSCPWLNLPGPRIGKRLLKR
eukprot:3434746-Pyramimonas_sp.AAC.1